MLEDLAENEKDKYATFWKEFGKVFKEGLNIPCGIVHGNGGVYADGSPLVAMTMDAPRALIASHVEPEVIDEKCENCGKPMALKRGRFGQFLACTGHPEFKTTRKIAQGAQAALA